MVSFFSPLTSSLLFLHAPRVRLQKAHATTTDQQATRSFGFSRTLTIKNLYTLILKNSPLFSFHPLFLFSFKRCSLPADHRLRSSCLSSLYDDVGCCACFYSVFDIVASCGACLLACLPSLYMMCCCCCCYVNFDLPFKERQNITHHRKRACRQQHAHIHIH
jgi:hypothetical protein